MSPSAILPRIMCRVSPNPLVKIRPVFAPARVISVLSPMVQA